MINRRSYMKLKNRLLAILTAAMLSTGVFSTPVQQFIGASVTAEAAASVATPTASRKSASYYCSGKLKVTLSCATKGATIYYSTNGGKSYRVYSKPLYFVKNGTIKFYAVKNGVKSKVASRTYKLVPKFTISLASGEYDGAKKVYLSSAVSGVKYYYTLDGSTPTTKSKLYTASGITIDESCKLRVRTSKSGWSAVISNRTYTINQDDDNSSIIAGESILDNYKVKYGYNQLTTTQKKLYAALFEGVAAHKTTIDVRSIGANADDLDKAFYAMYYESPQFFWLMGGYSQSYNSSSILTVSPMYNQSASQAAKVLPKIEAGIEDILEEAAKKESTFEVVKYLHDSIIDLTTYQRDNGTEYIRTPEGVFLYGKALCEGYAKTFAYLCQSMGIDCFCVGGKTEGGDHMWNLIKLDGKWYHMDVTHDDPTGTATPMCLYDYFCVTSAQIAKTHTLVDNPFTVPTCTATEYNYYKANDITVYTNATKAYNALLVELDKVYKNGGNYAYITCTKACKDTLYAMIKSKGSDVFDDLRAIGSSFSASFSYGYKGGTNYEVYIQF